MLKTNAMSAEAQTNNTVVAEKPFFYYPGFNEEFPRRVLAGLQDGTKINVAEAVCFPGKPARVIPVQLASGGTVYVVDPGVRADSFVRKDGKELALSRVRGWKMIPQREGAKNVFPGQQLIYTIDLEGDHIAVAILHDKTAPIIRIPITAEDQAQGGVSVGRAFVLGTEAYLAHYDFPVKPKKVKKSKTPQAPGESPEPTEV